MLLKITDGVSGLHGSAVSPGIFFPADPAMKIAVEKFRLRRQKKVMNISGSADCGYEISKVLFLCKAAKPRFIFQPDIQYQVDMVLKDFTKEIGCRRLISTDFKQTADSSHLRFCPDCIRIRRKLMLQVQHQREYFFAYSGKSYLKKTVPANTGTAHFVCFYFTGAFRTNVFLS